MNGYVEYTSPGNNSTICYKCGAIKSQHDSDHEYNPAKYALLYGDNTRDHQNIMKIFKSESNKYGKDIKTIIGSKVVREGLDFNALRDIFILTLPYNIPNLLQIMGRGIRQNSHQQLNPEDRDVNICIFASELQEIQDYIMKMKDYMKVQIYEKIIHENSVDNGLYDITVDKDSLYMIQYKVREYYKNHPDYMEYFANQLYRQ
jgi:superfamily II DNA or RNA helicase